MRIFGLHHVQVSIPPGGEAAARRFYSELLGLAEVEKPDSLGDRGGVWFACGDQQLHCGVEPEVARSRRHPALLTDDLETLRARLMAGGVPIVDDRQIPGYRRFYAEDPFGNRVELLQRDWPRWRRRLAPASLDGLRRGKVGSWFRGAWNKNPTGKYRKVSFAFPAVVLRLEFAVQ